MDTLTGMFGLGMEPTGSKDPFALRRAANAVVRLLAETDLPLTLDESLQAAGGVSDAMMARLRLFFAERVEFYLREVRGQAYDVAKAVMVSGQDDLRDLVARAEAVTAVRSGENAATFLAVAAAFKRMRNILEQAMERNEEVAESVDEALLKDEAERQLNETARWLRRRSAGWREAQYGPALIVLRDASGSGCVLRSRDGDGSRARDQGEPAGAGGQDREGLLAGSRIFLRSCGRADRSNAGRIAEGKTFIT